MFSVHIYLSVCDMLDYLIDYSKKTISVYDAIYTSKGIIITHTHKRLACVRHLQTCYRSVVVQHSIHYSVSSRCIVSRKHEALE